MRTIWKYPLRLGGQVLEMPAGSKPIRFAMQNDIPHLWAIVDAAHEQVPRTFGVFGTGHILPTAAEYIGTADQGPFVWHLFEMFEPV